MTKRGLWVALALAAVATLAVGLGAKLGPEAAPGAPTLSHPEWVPGQVAWMVVRVSPWPPLAVWEEWCRQSGGGEAIEVSGPTFSDERARVETKAFMCFAGGQDGDGR